MRVVLVMYPGISELVGGHVTQHLETALALRRRGVDAVVASPEEALADREADIVHAFGGIQHLLALGRPRGRLVATPIYFPRSVLYGPVWLRGGVRHVLEARLRHAARAVRHAGERRRRIAGHEADHAAWRQADLVVVNSRAEAALLERDAGRFENLRVAYSGVSGDAFGGDPAEGRRLLGVGDEPFVLSVARVERRKNHLSLALALRGLPVRLVILGAVLPGNEQCFADVRQALPDVVHVPHLDHPLVRHAHAAAALHALPSWYETTGLSTLEALAAGRPVVVAGGPCVREYFDGCASFCRPGSIRSIRRAVEQALEGPRGCELERARAFSWDRTAAELLDAYASVADAV
jgi:glycosyltransferase involved in cell wall biosynthesis